MKYLIIDDDQDRARSYEFCCHSMALVRPAVGRSLKCAFEDREES